MKKGFTLIEIMITIAIVGILAAIAVPSYLNYINKSRYVETIAAATSIKSAVAACIEVNGASTSCSNGSNGIPVATDKVGNLLSLSVKSGVITAVGNTGNKSYTYILNPTFANGTVIWGIDPASTCLSAGLCFNR